MKIREARTVLGVRAGDTPDEVKKAYRKLALETHPDKNGGDPAAKQRFQRVAEAYKRLSDPHARDDEEEEEPDSEDVAANDVEVDEEEMFAMFDSMFVGSRGGFAGASFGASGGSRAGGFSSAFGGSGSGGYGSDHGDGGGFGSGDRGFGSSGGDFGSSSGSTGGLGSAAVMDEVEDMMDAMIMAGFTPEEAMLELMTLARTGPSASAAAAAFRDDAYNFSRHSSAAAGMGSGGGAGADGDATSEFDEEDERIARDWMAGGGMFQNSRGGADSRSASASPGGAFSNAGSRSASASPGVAAANNGGGFTRSGSFTGSYGGAYGGYKASGSRSASVSPAGVAGSGGGGRASVGAAAARQPWDDSNGVGIGAEDEAILAAGGLDARDVAAFLASGGTMEDVAMIVGMAARDAAAAAAVTAVTAGGSSELGRGDYNGYGSGSYGRFHGIEEADHETEDDENDAAEIAFANMLAGVMAEGNYGAPADTRGATTADVDVAGSGSAAPHFHAGSGGAPRASRPAQRRSRLANKKGGRPPNGRKGTAVDVIAATAPMAAVPAPYAMRNPIFGVEESAGGPESGSFGGGTSSSLGGGSSSFGGFGGGGSGMMPPAAEEELLRAMEGMAVSGSGSKGKSRQPPPLPPRPPAAGAASAAAAGAPPAVPLAVGTPVMVRRRLAGTVRFCGPVSYAEGEWVGVELSEPSGRNDGEIKGTRYFSCRANHGIMVRPSEVTAIA